MTTAPAHGLTGAHTNHRALTLFRVVLAAIAVAATVIVLLVTSPWSSDSTSSANPPPPSTGHAANACFGGRVIHPC